MIASVLKSLEKPFIQGSVILNWLVDTRSEIKEFLRRQTAGTPDSQEVIYQTVVLPPGCSGLCFRFLFTVLRLLRFFAKFAIFAKIVKIAKIATRLGDFVFSSF